MLCSLALCWSSWAARALWNFCNIIWQGFFDLYTGAAWGLPHKSRGTHLTRPFNLSMHAFYSSIWTHLSWKHWYVCVCVHASCGVIEPSAKPSKVLLRLCIYISFCGTLVWINLHTWKCHASIYPHALSTSWLKVLIHCSSWMIYVQKAHLMWHFWRR